MGSCDSIRSRTVTSLVVASVLSLAAAVHADNRYVLLQQDSWEHQRGFYLSLENNGGSDPDKPASDNNAPLPLSTLRLALAGADGTRWHFIGATPGWQLGHTYHVVATIDSNHSALQIDGNTVAQGEGVAIAPEEGPVLQASTPDWANAPAAYAVSEQSASITSAGEQVVNRNWPAPSAQSAAQALFSPPQSVSDDDVHIHARQPLTLSAVFTLQAAQPDLHALAPMVDRYGQDRYGDWPGKLNSDQQLKSDVDDEQRRLAAMSPPSDLDSYGGSKSLGWSERGTGFYRVAQHNSFWWLITPTGLPCFYTGMCHAPSLQDNGTPVKGREYLFAELPSPNGPFEAAWSGGVWGETDNRYFSFDTANMISKYGVDHWSDTAQSLCSQRLHAFGFTGLGKWCDNFGGLPYVAVVGHPDDPKSGHGKLDVFDPAACERFRATAAAAVEQHRHDPLLVGWSVGNEMDEIVRTDDMAAILAAPTATPAKIAIVQEAIRGIYFGSAASFAARWHVTGTSPEQLAANPLTAPKSDMERLRHFYATAYYSFIYKTMKSLDPDHLYLGFWIVPGWWMNDSDWDLIAPYCDVIGYDHYDWKFADDHLAGLMRETNKPVLCGEFSYPPTYNGERGYSQYLLAYASTDADAGRRYADYLRDASLNPYCVGALWFEYRDEPLTGRGPGMGPNLFYDEHYAFGIVDVTDRPKWDLVTAMRAANLRAMSDRTAASGER